MRTFRISFYNKSDVLVRGCRLNTCNGYVMVSDYDNNIIAMYNDVIAAVDICSLVDLNPTEKE